MKLPAFQFYPGDWRKDPGVQALDFHDRGVWFEVLCLMHESEERGKLTLNGAPMPEDALARLLGLDKQILTTTLTTLLTYGVASRCDESGAIICRRMIRDENLRKIRANAGKMGGNPVLLKQNPTTHLKQIPTPSSSSSSSASTAISTIVEIEDTPSVKINKARGTIEDLKSFALEIGLAESDGENCFCKWESTGWKGIKDWRMKIRTWKHEGFHASQKNGSNKTHRKNEYPQETLELPD
jgi:hypothetical protein